MRPQYINGFSIAKNGDASEIIICFRQSYADSDNKLQTDDISSVVMSFGSAMQLKEILGKTLGVELG